MRPLAQKFALGVLCTVALAAAAVWSAPGIGAGVGIAVIRLASVAGAIASSPALAQEMKFTPLPPESTSQLDRQRSRRHSSSSTPPAVPPVPSVPSVPAVPEPGTAPTVVIGKSGDIMRVGSDIEVGKDEVVTGDVLAVGGDLRIQGHVEGNAVSMGGDIYLDPTARVDGDVVCMGGELHEEPGASVGGKRVVGLGKGRDMRVARRLRSYDHDMDLDVGRRTAHGLSKSLGWLLVWLLVGWATVKIAPGRTGAALESFRQAPGASFLTGWLALVLTVPGLVAVALLTALLCITIIGIPLGIALLFAYFLFLAVFAVWGGVVGAAVVGEQFSQRQGVGSPTLMRAVIAGLLLLDGALVLASLMRMMHFIPFFSGFGTFFKVLLIIANALVGVTGWGALLRSEFTTGIIARWWHGRRGSAGTPVTPAPVPGPVPASPASGVVVTSVPSAVAPPPAPAEPAPPPPPPTPPAPPESYMPPPTEGGMPS
jgi:hypothetical protein